MKQRIEVYKLPMGKIAIAYENNIVFIWPGDLPGVIAKLQSFMEN